MADTGAPHFEQGFINLDVRAVPPNLWKLLQPLKYTTYIRGVHEVITADKGFVNDLASIPPIFRRILPVNDVHRKAAVIHDWLYRYAGLHAYNRKESDQIFLEAMKVLGVSLWKRWAMYNAVRIGAGIFWKRNINRNSKR